jgi:hypothetical protein
LAGDDSFLIVEGYGDLSYASRRDTVSAGGGEKEKTPFKRLQVILYHGNMLKSIPSAMTGR